MLDIKFIRENPSLVQKAAQDKKVDVDIDHLLEVDQKRNELQKSVQGLQEKRNALAKAVSGKPTHAQIEEGKKIKEHLEKEDHALSAIKEELDLLLARVPNIPASDAPVGQNADANE